MNNTLTQEVVAQSAMSGAGMSDDDSATWNLDAHANENRHSLTTALPAGSLEFGDIDEDWSDVATSTEGEGVLDNSPGSHRATFITEHIMTPAERVSSTETITSSIILDGDNDTVAENPGVTVVSGTLVDGVHLPEANGQIEGSGDDGGNGPDVNHGMNGNHAEDRHEEGLVDQERDEDNVGASNVNLENPTQTTQTEARHVCHVCSTDLEADECIYVQCGKPLCRECLNSAFRIGLEDKASFPPRCCEVGEIAIDLAQYFLEEANVLRFFEVAEEFRAVRPLYCANKICAKFISETPIEHVEHAMTLLTCSSCKTETCAKCRELPAEHAITEGGATCPDVIALAELGGLVEQEGWKRCPGCQHMVEKVDGCDHMTCFCRMEFHYICGGAFRPGGECDCPDRPGWGPGGDEDDQEDEQRDDNNAEDDELEANVEADLEDENTARDLIVRADQLLAIGDEDNEDHDEELEADRDDLDLAMEDHRISLRRLQLRAADLRRRIENPNARGRGGGMRGNGERGFGRGHMFGRGRGGRAGHFPRNDGWGEEQVGGAASEGDGIGVVHEADATDRDVPDAPNPDIPGMALDGANEEEAGGARGDQGGFRGRGGFNGRGRGLGGRGNGNGHGRGLGRGGW